ncbi:MAG: TonB-dependent receptor [Bacteroidetes bacterium]|nr:MAG: TonB-dependent receptor [Bacteroidota bacterium]
MNPVRKNILFIFFAVLVCAKGFSQEKLISVSFDQSTFEDVVKDLESKTDFHFYYDPIQFDSFQVSIHVVDKSVPYILKQIFQGTDYRFSIDSHDRIYVVKRLEILTTLPPGFFDKRSRKDSLAYANITADTSGETDKPTNTATSENKLYEIGIKGLQTKPGSAIITGYVKDSKNGEPIIGAAVYVENTKTGTVTDQFGYFTLTLSRGRHQLKITSVGMKDARRQIMLYSDGKLNIEMFDFIPSLKAIVVVAEKASNVKGVQMGLEKVSIRTIKQVPVVFGEADVLRVVLTLPGVTSVGEASTGFNVRGGAADQNLILFNDATVYNPSHLFGFFSAFNPDCVQDIELYKSSIPEKYGGRLSSVLDVTTRNGNKKKIAGTGGIGPLTGRFTLEGPIWKDRTTFVIGARTSYSNWILRNLHNDEFNKSKASFYDANLHISHEFNSKNNLYITGYISKDQFKLNSDTTYGYSNRNLSIKWKHIFNSKFYGIATTGIDNYQYDVSSSANPVNAFDLKFKISQYNARFDFSYAASAKHSLDFGVTSVLYKLDPGSLNPVGDKSLVTPDIVQPEQGLETAVYVGDKFDISSKLSINIGLRYSMFNYIGPHDVNSYAEGLPKEESNITDTTHYNKGNVINTYRGPEYRVSARFAINDVSSIKASYNTTRQYIHSISNTASISPTDIWKLSDPNIKPQLGEQISLGYYHNFRSNTIETSVEVYYKNIDNYLDYKSGATLILNHHLETDVMNTKGRAYGIEFLLKRTTGKLNGWISYAYSRTELKMDDPSVGPVINHGNYYPANYDKPNNLNVIANYRFTHRFSMSMNVVYSTGRPITLPVAVFDLAGAQRLYYSDRNAYRIPDYFRMDFSMTLEGNHKVKQWLHSSWSAGVYNLSGRKNPYSIYFVQENGVIHGYKLSIFGTAIPFITYNFKF